MAAPQPRVQTVAWAWAAGWALAAAGMSISDVYSTPNRGLIAAYSLGVIGWVTGGTETLRHRGRFEVTAPGTTVSIAGWILGALAAVALGQRWLVEWNLAYWGPIVSAGLGGTIGGAFTLPRRSWSSPATAVRLGLESALAWGVSFLLFQTLAFFAGYILMQMTVDPLVPIVGHQMAKVLGWAIPAGLAGLLAARLALRLQAEEAV